jgi:membrane fusion protein (multidrug efflux system)
VGAVIALAAGVYFLIPWVLTTLNTVSTDDAYVNSHVTFVAPRVKGQVVRVLVDDNYRIRRGDILVQLDKQPYRVEVDRKKAALDIAQSKLVQARATVKATAATSRALRHQMVNAIQLLRSQIQELQADVATLAKDEALLEDARKEYVRAETLLRNGGAASREEFDQRRAAWLAAEATVQAAGVRATPHTFRHQAITWLTRHSGMADAELQLITGHAKRETLSIYQHVALDGQLEERYQKAMRDAEL